MDGGIAIGGIALGVLVVALRAMSKAVALDKQVMSLRTEIDKLRAESKLPPVDRDPRDQKR
jgi:hypothetical protein